MNIIGLSMGYHDSACCLLRDGVLVAAVQEERFSRVKNDKAIPRSAFRFCLQRGGLSIDEVDCVAFYEDPCLKLGRQIWSAIDAPQSAETPQAMPQRAAILARLLGDPPAELIRRTLGYEGRIEIVDHHLSHAASAYYFSGFSDAAILTVDGVGDWPTTTYNSATGERIERLEAVDYPHSLGLFYSTLTGYLGFEVNEGEYKVMGLAPYGQPRYLDKVSKLILPGPGGQYRLDLRYFDFRRTDRMYTPELVDLLGRPARKPEEPLEPFHMDLARSVQLALEEVLLEKVRYLHQRAPSEQLCLAGGVALNVVANSRCLREGPFKRLFVQPAAGDAGGALGAAAVAGVRLGAPRPGGPLRHVYLGPDNSTEAVHRLLKSTTAPFGDFRGRQTELLGRVVDALIQGKVIGWCQGRCEFGPRALGARSILADPRRPEMRDRINASVKMREGFRPFAPSVLAAEQSRHFELDHDSPFMLETCSVRSRIDLPAITHVDNTARIHTVAAADNPRYAALLEEFFRRTDCPILLNTSFNLKGEPIVLSAYDAISTFVRSSIDLLVIEDFLLERTHLPALWRLLPPQPSGRSAGSGTVSHLVYSFL
jgi:carbamoyltransferase